MTYHLINIVNIEPENRNKKAVDDTRCWSVNAQIFYHRLLSIGYWLFFGHGAAAPLRPERGRPRPQPRGLPTEPTTRLPRFLARQASILHPHLWLPPRLCVEECTNESSAIQVNPSESGIEK